MNLTHYMISAAFVSMGLIWGALYLPAYAQESAGTHVLVQCPQLSVTMQFGARDAEHRNQVSELQRFLSELYDLDPIVYVTGYFGNMTRQNVRKFQCEHLGLCAGSEASNGYGVVGPATRRKIAEVCAGAFSRIDTSMQSMQMNTQNSARSTQSSYTGEASAGRPATTTFIGRITSMQNSEQTRTQDEVRTYAQPSYYSQGEYYAQGEYYRQGSYWGATEYAQPAYYSQASYYSKPAYYSQGTYYAQASYSTGAGTTTTTSSINPAFSVLARKDGGVGYVVIPSLAFSSPPPTTTDGYVRHGYTTYWLQGDYRVKFSMTHVPDATKFYESCTASGAATSLVPSKVCEYTFSYPIGIFSAGGYENTIQTATLYHNGVPISTTSFFVNP